MLNYQILNSRVRCEVFCFVLFIIKLARGIKKLSNQEWESFLFWAQAGGDRKRGREEREREGGRAGEKETEKFIPKFQQNQ